MVLIQYYTHTHTFINLLQIETLFFFYRTVFLKRFCMLLNVHNLKKKISYNEKIYNIIYIKY